MFLRNCLVFALLLPDFSTFEIRPVMRKYLQLLVALTLLISIHTVSIAQPPPPPNGGHGSNGDQVPGGGAPIGEGMFLLFGLAGLYAGKKVNDLRKPLKVE